MMQVTEPAQSREKMLAMNEALMLGSLRQHELTEAAELSNVQLQREISERKQVEAALRESEARYHSLFNSIDEGFCVIEKVEGSVGGAVDFRYLEANPAFATQSGMSDMVGKTIRQALPDEPEGWCLIYDTVLRTGEPIKFERGLVSHGRVLELYAFRVEDKSHRRVAVIFKDITERKQTEAVLRESEERFHALFELGPVAVYSCDASGVIQNFNRRAAELWGREPALEDTDERFCGSFKLFRPDGSFMPHEQCPMADVISGKISEVRDAEVFIERPDGSEVSVVVNIRPLKSERGEITGAINCFYDITERKEAEQRQRFLMNELAHRSKNLLAVIASIASRSLSGTRSLTEAREVLTHRIQALARSQSALMTGGLRRRVRRRDHPSGVRRIFRSGQICWPRCAAEPQGSADLRARCA
jgi:PAS domain S-box-containing protein